MITPKEVFGQIERLTGELIATGLCDTQNFPSMKNGKDNSEEIGISEKASPIFLKNISYHEMYYELEQNKQYNIKMIDGALISMNYTFRKKRLESHCLSFFPSPDLEIFQNDPEMYVEDELYSDIVDKRVVTVPIRFDFDRTKGTYNPIDHPISHLTLGQYKNCRIPVTTALTPYQFLLFIIINFYHTAYEKCNTQFSIFKDCFESTIFEEEKGLLHIHTPIYQTIKMESIF